MTPTDEPDECLLPIAYADEGPSALEQALRHGLKRDATWLDPRTEKGHARALTVLLPAIERAGVFTLEQLTDDEGLMAVRASVAAEIGDSPNAASTWSTRLGQFTTRCESAGMLPADAIRLKKTLNQSLKSAAKPAEQEPAVTDEMLRALHAVMLEWRDAPTERYGSEGCHEGLVGVIGYRGRRVTTARRDRALAVVSITLAGVPRTGDVVRLKRGDIRGGIVRTQVAKGHIMQPVVEYALGDLAAFVRPLLARVGDDPNSSLFDTSGQALGDVRAMLLSAEWPEHHGRVGLHRLRKAFIRVNYEAGRSPSDTSAGLNNSPAVAERAYAIAVRGEQAAASREAWMAKVSDLTSTPPRHRFPEGTEPAPWAEMSNGSWTTNPTDEDAPDLSGAWRLRWVEIRYPQADELGMPDEHAWGTYCAAESSVGDLLVSHYPFDSSGNSLHSLGDGSMTTRPLWLETGALHARSVRSTASNWYECRDLNPGSGARPVEAILPAYAAAMSERLAAGDFESVNRMLDLLAALGGGTA